MPWWATAVAILAAWTATGTALALIVGPILARRGRHYR